MLLPLSDLSVTLLPEWFAGVLERFAPHFSARILPQVQLLVVGAVLSPGKRAVTAALRVLGLADDPKFGTFHRLLNRARWRTVVQASANDANLNNCMTILASPTLHDAIVCNRRP